MTGGLPPVQSVITFGQKYDREPHGTLPGWACDPDGWLEVRAASRSDLVSLLPRHVGTVDGQVIECAWIYSPDDFDAERFPRGCVGWIDADGLHRADQDGGVL